jgi:uncharacterized protein (DUF1015 family)
VSEIAAVPYDVVTTDEARIEAEGHPLNFLRVSRPELELPPGTDPYSDRVYQRAVDNFDQLKPRLIVEEHASVYLYRLRQGTHEQVGVAACFSLDEYDRDIIKKHERTRRDKEDDRTRHMLALGAQTGPVFLTYRSRPDIHATVSRAAEQKPLFDFTASDGVSHTVWRVDASDREALVSAFGRVPFLYIADGHHRAASAARARNDIRDAALTRSSLGDGADDTSFLAVAFPHDQVQILAYNRTVRDLGGRSPDAFLTAVTERFEVADGVAVPIRSGDLSMYLGGRWRTLRVRSVPDSSDPIRSLDVSVLQEQLLAPILGIADIRTDKRVDFVGGGRGTAALEAAVNSGRAAVAFSLFPVRVEQLMAVSDAGEIMPPKSTWFEPKLRDGLLIHLI